MRTPGITSAKKRRFHDLTTWQHVEDAERCEEGAALATWGGRGWGSYLATFGEEAFIDDAETAFGFKALGEVFLRAAGALLEDAKH